MAITHTWAVANLERETATGRVTTVHYTVSSTDGVYNTGAYGSIGLDGDVVTPFGELTPEICVGWVKDHFGAEKVAEVEAALEAQLSKMAAPTMASGTPW